jgi:hypothetical protein
LLPRAHRKPKLGEQAPPRPLSCPLPQKNRESVQWLRTEPTIKGSPDSLTDAQLGERARTILDGVYRDELAAWRSFFEASIGDGRAATDIAQAARAATMGAVDSILVDIDETIRGRIDERGAVVFAKQASATNYGLVDEIATRVLATGGRVIGVRKADIPQGDALAAILRYPV